MKILFVCTANSCRSQMAEALGRNLLPRAWEICSAGLLIYPITDDTRRVMREVGLDLAGHKSKTLDVFDLDDFDLVVTLSEEAGQFLPTLSRPERHLHRPLPDPMGTSGPEAEVLRAFRQARDRIRQIVQEIAAGRIPLRRGSAD